MFERTVYGPIEFLAPDQDLNSTLEITGIKIPSNSFTTHVFFEEITGDDLETLIRTSNYAGSFSFPEDAEQDGGKPTTVRFDVTKAIRKAEQRMPNFHITFLTETQTPRNEEKLFRFESLHIEHHVPANTDLDISAKVT